MDNGTQGMEARRTNARRARTLLAVSIPLLVVGGIVFFSTGGGISPVLILGVALALIAKRLRDRAEHGDRGTPGRALGDQAAEEPYLPPMLTWPPAERGTDLFPYRGATYSLGLVRTNERSRYVIRDPDGNHVGDYLYASDGWLHAWKAFRDLEPAAALPNEDPRQHHGESPA